MDKLQAALQKIQAGTHHNPFEVLGWHKKSSQMILRTFMPAAEQVKWGRKTLKRIAGTDIFQWEGRKNKQPEASLANSHPLLDWQDKKQGEWHQSYCPYTFKTQSLELDLHLFGEGRHHHIWKVLGSHLMTIDHIDGCCFRVWAPGAKRVSVIGEFNAWDGRCHTLQALGNSGVWELFIPNLPAGEAYKYEILGAQETLSRKTDPYARQMFMRPETTSCIISPSEHQWQDQDWLSNRETWDWLHEPISIYEVHATSWRLTETGQFYNWRTLAAELIPYVKELGYTHIELLPISEHPLDASWGYQVSGYYAPTARLGTPDDLRYFIDQCHQNNMGVLLDWVPAHFPKDDWALARFTGEPLYEYADPRKGEHRDWGTLIFDYGRNEVKNFLLANAVYWLDEFHIDGLRVDAVASMLYLNYSRTDGNWLPNQYGGHENLEAIAFLRDMNKTVHGLFKGVLTIAEESTSWPAVSRPLELGGLGFSMKWNMGWMNDNLDYMEQDPIYRKYHHNKLTFGLMYAWAENFMLPLSHDEVVHMKRSMLDKMPGDEWCKFANLRLFYAWQYASPGKKLLFMGGEIGQWREWSEARELDWDVLNYPKHRELKTLVADLNKLYRQHHALHEWDFDGRGFRWIDCNDHEQSVVSLLRSGQDPDEQVVIILNFTPIPRSRYRIGVPQSGVYQEIFNTDSRYYGGSDCGNPGALHTESKPWMGFGQSLELTLPPLGALFLKWQTTHSIPPQDKGLKKLISHEEHDEIAANNSPSVAEKENREMRESPSPKEQPGGSAE